jgi:hypothetical protein
MWIASGGSRYLRPALDLELRLG